MSKQERDFHTVPGYYFSNGGYYFRKDRQREKNRGRDRTNRLQFHGRTIRGLQKRPYTNYCELCGIEQKKHLNYHHWDDRDYNKGIWVHFECHQLCELIDKEYISLAACSSIPLAKKYLQFKSRLDSQFQRNK